jgi:hypothetical protein
MTFSSGVSTSLAVTECDDFIGNVAKPSVTLSLTTTTDH